MKHNGHSSSFEHLRKQAKQWLKAIRSGDGAARERLERVLPRHSEVLGLREVQQALAREQGFESWAALKEQQEVQALETGERRDLVLEFLERACIFSSQGRDFPEHWRRAERIRARHPAIATTNIHTAVVCGEVEHVAELLHRNRQLITEKGGRQQWEPLLFVCYSRLPNERAASRSLEMAKLLLDAGANPNSAFVLSGDDWACRFTALTGAMGEGEMGQPPHPTGDGLARLLLDRGADPNDGQGLYNTHLAVDETKWLELLSSYGLNKEHLVNWDPTPPKPGVEPTKIFSYLVAQAASAGHKQRLRWLLAHGADANAKSHYTSKSCYREALLAGKHEIAEILLVHGAKAEMLEGEDAFVAACNAGQREAASKLLEGHAEYLADVEALLSAAQRGDIATLALLLEFGMDPNGAGKHGHLALHNGAGRREVAELLWKHGADPKARCFGATVADWALHGGHREMARAHAARSRSLLDAVRTGHLELAVELLQEDPARVNERTPSGDGVLHRLPDDAELAQPLIALLLAHGADPTAKNDSGQSAAEKLESDGLDTIADLIDVAREF